MVKLLIRKCFQESTIHGFPFIVNAKIHLIEKFFWLIAITFSIFYSCLLCLDQWDRFRTNPIVYSVEKNYQNWKLPKVGITICSNYENRELNAKIVYETWNVAENETKFEYYMSFLEALLKVNYTSFHILAPFKDDQTIENKDFLELILKMRAPLDYNQNTLKVNEKSKNDDDQYNERVAVITEVGMCFSSSLLHHYQNPYGSRRQQFIKKIEYCGALDECNLKIIPPFIDGDHLKVYFHGAYDLMTVEDRHVIRRDVHGRLLRLSVELQMSVYKADRSVRNLPVSGRKCLFRDENSLEYYHEYTPTLCRLSCRINEAYRLCKCRPFLFNVGPTPICNINGLLCLAKLQNLWYNTTCQCPDLCEYVSYADTKALNQVNENFERSIVVDLTFPNVLIVRRVIFSMDQLVTSFGGAASFFLGCNFLSCIEILYFIGGYFCEKCRKKLFQNSSSIN